MPRPRFAKLDAAKQAHILEIAAAEFAKNGLEGASYNRIIDQAGLSKGAMYYYFDDKTDLYVTVLKDAIARVMAAVAEAAPPDGDYWSQFEHMVKHSIEFTRTHPEVAALARGMLGVSDRLRADGALGEIYDTYRVMTEELLEQGQSLGQVRTDLPMPLLVSVTFAMGEAIDRWWLERFDDLPDEELDHWAKALVGLFRRVAEPRGDNE